MVSGEFPRKQFLGIKEIVERAIAQKAISAEQEHKIANFLRENRYTASDLEALDLLTAALRDQKVVYADNPFPSETQ